MSDINISDADVKRTLVQTFEEVKMAALTSEGRSRAGLMLGLQEIGTSLQGFIGAYYPISSNIIVVNKTPLRRITETNPSLLKPYGFHVLLHEYIHSLGFLNETITRKKTYEISKQYFGETHVATQLATNITKFFPNLVYPMYGWMPPQKLSPIELVHGFDHSSSNQYIA
jgi:hypothetical protein